MKKNPIWLVIIVVFICTQGIAFAKKGQGIVKTKHNLSAKGPGKVKSTKDQYVCRFCHVPHVNKKIKPLWYKESKAIYITYKSSSLKAEVGQPTGSSRLCLSCHDGSIALGKISSKKKKIPFIGGITKLPPGRTNLGIDLSDDHPISFVYDNNLAFRNGQLAVPSILGERVKLDENSQLQCTTCHEPHSNAYRFFLVMDNINSALCITCHKITDWQTSSHSISNATWSGTGQDPWPDKTYTTVDDNGCENCHQPHSAEGRERLLRYREEEKNCYSCHNGQVAGKDVKSEFEKASRHPIESYAGVHKPDEDPLWGDRHVECEDCHNPHATFDSKAKAPYASGKLSQLKGISTTGTPVDPLKFEYELCYRCHSENPGGRTPVVTRHIFEKDLSRKFDPSNASYHPVEAIGKNRSVPSLIIPLNTSSQIYCTDCHNSDSKSGPGGIRPSGPHGSSWAPILERQLITTDFTMESYNNYDLCYKCHSRELILQNQSFSEHSRHIVDQRTPCTACHDSHGVKENPHLINFDQTIVSSNEQGILHFEDNGRFSGSCSLKCHNQNHDNRVYPPREEEESTPQERRFRIKKKNFKLRRFR